MLTLLYYSPLQLITTYATNFITKTQLEALYSHMSVSPSLSDRLMSGHNTISVEGATFILGIKMVSIILCGCLKLSCHIVNQALFHGEILCKIWGKSFTMVFI